MRRVSDITLGDFWGYKSENTNDKNDDKGITLLLINTHKGELILNKIKDNIQLFSRSLEFISNSQKSLSSSWSKPNTYDEFWDDYNNLSFNHIIKKWAYPEKRTLLQYLSSEFGLFFLVRIINYLKYKLIIIYSKN